MVKAKGDGKSEEVLYIRVYIYTQRVGPEV